MIDHCFSLSHQLGVLCNQKNMRIGLAESCTGGLLASELTAVPGCSRWFDGCLVTYSNTAKMSCLHVKQNTLEQYGAVSEAVVKEMTQGVIDRLQSDIALAISGIAGPQGGTIEKPVGTVCFALADKNTNFCEAKTVYFSGDRQQVRLSAIEFALQWLLNYLSDK